MELQTKAYEPLYREKKTKNKKKQHKALNTLGFHADVYAHGGIAA